MAVHWPIYPAMRKETVFNLMLHPEKFPCWSKRRDQGVWHYKLGSRAPFVLAAWPRFLHLPGRRRKTVSLELHNLVSPLPVLGMRDHEMLSEAQWCFPTASFSKRSSMGHSGVQHFWGCVWTLAERWGERKSDVPAAVATFPFPANVPRQLQYLNVSYSVRVFFSLNFFQAVD